MLDAFLKQQARAYVDYYRKSGGSIEEWGNSKGFNSRDLAGIRKYATEIFKRTR